MNEAQLVVPAKKRTPNPDNWINRLSLFGGVSILWLGSAIIIVNSIDNKEERGQFGDMFGAVNSLLSGLAFAGIIYTIILQRIELKAQRVCLKLNCRHLE